MQKKGRTQKLRWEATGLQIKDESSLCGADVARRNFKFYANFPVSFVVEVGI